MIKKCNISVYVVIDSGVLLLSLLLLIATIIRCFGATLLALSLCLGSSWRKTVGDVVSLLLAVETGSGKGFLAWWGLALSIVLTMIWPLKVLPVVERGSTTV